MDVFCGIDWAEDHHDIALVDRDGQLLARRRISDDAAGLAALLTARQPRRQRRRPDPGGDRNPARAADRLPARHRPPGLPHQPDGCGPLPGPALGRGPQIRPRRRGRPGEHLAHRPARAPAAARRHRARAGHRGAGPRPARRRLGAHHRAQQAPLHLREYYPGFLAAFAGARGGIMRPEARTILAAAPTPAAAAALTLTQLRALLSKAGRSRGIDAEATRLREAFRAPQMRQLPLVEQAMGRQALALLRHLDAACTAAGDLEHAAIESFNQHPDAGIITSFPGLGPLTGARVLAETGDDRSRFTDAKGLKAYAGAAPITRASGKTTAVLHRRVKNQRLAATGYVWAFAALTASPGARAHYDRRKTNGDRHAAAQRNLFGTAPRLPAPLPGHQPALRRKHRLPQPRPNTHGNAA